MERKVFIFCVFINTYCKLDRFNTPQQHAQVKQIHILNLVNTITITNLDIGMGKMFCFLITPTKKKKQKDYI